MALGFDFPICADQERRELATRPAPLGAEVQGDLLRQLNGGTGYPGHSYIDLAFNEL